MGHYINDEQWAEFEEKGYVKIGTVADDSVINGLQQRIDDIMLGRAAVGYDRLTMQEDGPPDDHNNTKPHTPGHKGTHLNYRKIQNLERDPRYLQYMQLPVFAEACANVYGPDTPITVFRAMFFNKPAKRGMFLNWHQDAWNFLDRAPLLTAWTALDAATVANGCVKVIEGSHKTGRINPESRSGFLNNEEVAQYCCDDNVVYLTLGAGEVALLHNWLLHSSDCNSTDTPRRAFSFCCMDATTKRIDGVKATYPQIFGPDALNVDQLRAAG